jgi:site-specific recombinase XerD
MDIIAAGQEWQFAGRARGHSHRSLDWNQRKLRRFSEWCATQDIRDVEAVTAALVNRFLVSLPPALTNQTRKGYAQSIKALLNYCAREDLVSEKIPHRISMPRVTAKVIETYTPDQVRRLLAACEREVYPAMRVRDRALVSVLLDTGLRAGELCGLTLGNVHFGQDSYLQVMGKGRHERQVGLGDRSRAELHRYIYRHRNAPESQQRVWVNQKGRPLLVGGLDQLLYRLRDWAGPDHFEGIRVSSHIFRHTFAVAYLSRGAMCTSCPGYLGTARSRPLRSTYGPTSPRWRAVVPPWPTSSYVDR